MTKLTIGVLALQGAFHKHRKALEKLSVLSREVRTPEDLHLCDGLIIPGGESTCISKLMDKVGLTKQILSFSQKKPLFGTCAGLILMAKRVSEPSVPTLSLLDLSLERNGFGTQINSFACTLPFCDEREKNNPIQAVFIRAPRITEIGPDVKVLSRLDDEPVLVRQGIHLGCSFHPELTEDTSVHQTFIRIVEETSSPSSLEYHSCLGS